MDKKPKTYWEIEDFSNPYQMGPQKHRLYILDKLKELEEVKDIIVNIPGEGTRLSANHLF